MTDGQKEIIVIMRKEGYGYRVIVELSIMV